MVLRRTKQFNRQLVAEGIKACTMNGDVYLLCPVCHEYRPVELRLTADGVVRNQPRCSSCRGGRKRRVRRLMTQLPFLALVALLGCGGGSFTAGLAQPIPEEASQDAHDEPLEDVVHLAAPAPSSDGGQEATDANGDEKQEASDPLDSGPENSIDAAPYCFECFGVKVCAPCCVVCNGGNYCAPGCPR